VFILQVSSSVSTWIGAILDICDRGFAEGVAAQIQVKLVRYRGVQVQGHMAPAQVASTRRSDHYVAACSGVLIRNLSMSTTSEALCGHFSRFGSVKDALIPKYRGVSAGLGIVSFNHPRDVEFVMAQSTHIIDSVQVEVGRLQWDRPLEDHATFVDQQQYSQVEESPRLFVSRLCESVTAEMLETFFSQFGTITKVTVHGFNGEMRPQYDHHDGSTRSQSSLDQAAAATGSGYGFVSFNSKHALDAAMPPGRNRAFHLIHGAMVEVKRAIPYSRQRARS